MFVSLTDGNCLLSLRPFLGIGRINRFLISISINSSSSSTCSRFFWLAWNVSMEIYTGQRIQRLFEIRLASPTGRRLSTQLLARYIRCRFLFKNKSSAWVQVVVVIPVEGNEIRRSTLLGGTESKRMETRGNVVTKKQTAQKGVGRVELEMPSTTSHLFLFSLSLSLYPKFLFQRRLTIRLLSDHRGKRSSDF